MENERSTAINPSESVEEKVSLSDRFGLWIGFHNMDQNTFLDIIDAYCEEYKISIESGETVFSKLDRKKWEPFLIIVEKTFQSFLFMYK